ncbi:MAG: PQQ-binding-like beta-propeller repeat protein [Phycisphaerales bacterium]|nr:MAG: PQQ-binding-like beta-propeller repeat protein [Phycisphaerales bacterium]
MPNIQTFLTLSLIIALCAHPGLAQPAAPLAAEVDWDPVPHQDVYLDDSFEAVDAIAQGSRWASQGRWEEAARLLQETADSAGGKLIRVDDDYYVSIQNYINELVCTWPQQGVDAYRDLYEREIESALSRTSRLRLEETVELFDRFFCTRAAARLADRIGQAAIESGDFALAERVYRRVLEDHPDRGQYAPRYRAMLAVIATMQGTGPVELEEDDLQAKVTFKGQHLTLGDVIAMVQVGFAEAQEAESADEWPTFGGRASRSRISGTNVDELGLRWRYSEFSLRASPEDDSGFAEAFRRSASFNRLLTIHPVLSGELVFVQQQRSIIALDRNTGRTVWQYQAESDLEFDSEGWDAPPPAWSCLTVHAGRVFASIPSTGLPYFGYETPAESVELICLHSDTGKLLWHVKREDIGEESEAVSFDPAPLAVGNKVYLVGRRRRSFGFEDCYLFCFNAQTGSPVFRTHLGSASTGIFSSRQGSMSLAAACDDRIYVCTNLGTIAAVSAHTGAVSWLRLYERDRVTLQGTLGRTMWESELWHHNSVICTEDRLVCMPSDAMRVLVLDTSDGEIVLSVPTADLGGAATLLGAEGDRICTVGDEVVLYDLRKQEVIWRTPFPGEAEVQGRGVWAGDRVLVPTRAGICAFQATDGSLTSMSWDVEGTPGNLLALPDQLLVAGAGTLSSYVRKADIWARLEAAMQEAPADPLPALELAEVALNDGDYARAMTVLAEAVRRAGDLLEPLDPDLQQRFYEDVIQFVTTLEARKELDLERLDKLFVYASESSPDAASNLAYRRLFAAFFERYGSPTRSVRLYQQILSDRSLRELNLQVEGGERVSAAAFAKAKIAEALSQYGPELYAPFERRAAELFNQGVRERDLGLLQRVVDTFPNSASAQAALLAQADLHSAAGDHVKAAKALSNAYHRYAAADRRPELLRRIADEYERAGKLTHAYRWLTKGAREHPGATIEYDGRMMSFEKYRERLADIRVLVEPSRPSVRLPLQKQEPASFDAPVELLVPRFGEDHSSSWDRVYVFEGAAIRAYESRRKNALWPEPVAMRLKPELLLATDQFAVFATLYEVFALEATSGKRLWSYGEYPPQLDEAGADWEQTGAYIRHKIAGGRLVTMRDDARLSCVELTTGQLLWDMEPDVPPAGPMRLSESWLAYQGKKEGRITLCLVEAETGNLLSTTTTDRRWPTDEMFVTLDGQILLIAAQSVASYDPETGTRLWNIDLQGHVRTSSILLDVDAMYFSSNGRNVTKIGLGEGKQLWLSQRVLRSGDAGLTLALVDGNLIVTSEDSVSALDPVTGVTLWQGLTPDSPRFAFRMITDAYVVAVHLPPADVDEEAAVFFYDYRNASGVIPREGGFLKLGEIVDTEVRAVGVYNDALLMQIGGAIQVWHP